jgi:hypothetical protein
VIDALRDVAYFVSRTYSSAYDSSRVSVTDSILYVEHYMHCVDVYTLQEVTGWPVKIGGGYNGVMFTWSEGTQLQRAAMTLLNGVIYAPFSGSCDNSVGGILVNTPYCLTVAYHIMSYRI